MDERMDQDGPADTTTLPRKAYGRLPRKAGRILAVTVAAIVAGFGIFIAGYAVGSAPNDSKASETSLPPIHDSDFMPHVTPPRTCEAPSPLNPGTETHEPTETEPQPPTEPCIAPAPDIVVLLSAAKAKELPAGVGGTNCELTDEYSTDYSACNPRPANDVETIVKKVLTPEQLAFVNDHVLSSEMAYWVFVVQDTAALKNQYMVPGATYDESTETITIYNW